MTPSWSCRRLAWLCGLCLPLLGPAQAFPGRRSAEELWCPGGGAGAGAEAGPQEPVLRRIVQEGPRVWGDSGVPENTPPPWMDARRVAAGKAFTQKYPVAVMYANVHALYLLLAIQPVLDVLVYTGNSDTPDEAFIRYYDTVKAVGQWFLSDIFAPGSEGFEQLRRVRGLHNLVRRDMADRPQDAVRNKTRLAGDFSGCPISAAIRRDLGRASERAACPGSKRRPQQGPQQGQGDQDPDQSDNAVGEDGGAAPGTVWMSQYDMSLTQWAFVGPVIQFPESYGIGNATEEELDGYVHLWEVIGYALGIEDSFNFCQGGLAATLRRSREVLSLIVLPSLRRAAPPWEYMARCMADGLGYIVPGVDFKTQLATLLSVTLDSPAPGVEAQLSAAQRQAVQGYRGIMDRLRRDRGGALWTPVGSSFKQILLLLSKSVSPEDVKRIRHRPPHRSRACYPELEPLGT